MKDYKKHIKIYVTGGRYDYIRGVSALVSKHKYKIETTRNISKADLVIFSGGEDVDPSLYKHPKHVLTGSNPIRDKREMGIYDYCILRNIPMFGVCRGAQFLTVMNGGKLIQHCTGHSSGRLHLIDAIDLDTGAIYMFEMSSTHHQMMYPYNLPEDKYELLSWSSEKLSSTYMLGNEDAKHTRQEPKKEPEIVYYKDTNCLCVQGHPEHSTVSEEVREHIANLVVGTIFKPKSATS